MMAGASAKCIFKGRSHTVQVGLKLMQACAPKLIFNKALPKTNKGVTSIMET